MADPVKPTILVVDDIVENVDILVETLSPVYEISVALNGEEALEAVDDHPPDLILLDVMMPGMDGHEVCARLKANPTTKGIPVIFVTAMSEDTDEARGLALGAIDYITKPFSPELVMARVSNHLNLKKYRDHLEELVEERTRELRLTQEVTIEALGTLAEYRDPETGGHIHRTQHYVKALAEHLRRNPRYRDKLDSETIDLLYRSAPLHDIGKVGVPDNILLKPGRLTPEEQVEMHRHSGYGRDAIASQERKLGSNSFLHHAKEIAGCHHEKWDGSGYPLGMSGDAIPVSARLMAIADVYDALISRRVYKPPMTHEKAVEIITASRGSHFDPEMVDAFAEISEEFRRIALENAESAEEREALLVGRPDKEKEQAE